MRHSPGLTATAQQSRLLIVVIILDCIAMTSGGVSGGNDLPLRSPVGGDQAYRRNDEVHMATRESSLASLSA